MSRSEKFWHSKAQRYAQRPISDEVVYQRNLSETQRRLSSDMSILEFGCGTGTTAVHHAPHVKHISFDCPFTYRVIMSSSKEKMFEYAYYEGNYAMGGILRGARLLESPPNAGAE
jgi:hypothetical protein